MPLLTAERKLLIGMIHLPPLPGSARYAGLPFEAIVERAVADAETLARAGFDAAIVQNTHDIPTPTPALPETIAFLAVAGAAIRQATPLPLGVNIRKADAAGALSIAAAIDAAFVRVKVYVGAVLTPEGVVEGSVAEALRTRQRLGATTEIWADLFDRTSVPLVPQPIGEAAHWAVKFGDATAVIVANDAFADTLADARAIRARRPDVPVVIGGGVVRENLGEALAVADAVIVGSALEARPFTGPVSYEKAAAFVAAANQVPGLAYSSG